MKPLNNPVPFFGLHYFLQAEVSLMHQISIVNTAEQKRILKLETEIKKAKKVSFLFFPVHDSSYHPLDPVFFSTTFHLHLILINYPPF